MKRILKTILLNLLLVGVVFGGCRLLVRLVDNAHQTGYDRGYRQGLANRKFTARDINVFKLTMDVQADYQAGMLEAIFYDIDDRSEDKLWVCVTNDGQFFCKNILLWMDETAGRNMKVPEGP